MINYRSTVEGQWVEITPITMTEEQKAVLLGSDMAAKIALVNTLNEQATSPVAEPSALVAMYEQMKPTLKDGDTYELISVDIVGSNGILNCRVNSEHKQVRLA